MGPTSRRWRKKLASAIHLLISALDDIDAGKEDLEDTGDREPDDTGVADRDALATMQRAQSSWYEDEHERDYDPEEDTNH